MGRYCVCGLKFTDNEIEDYKKCDCQWSYWVSCCDFPTYRGNKKEKISLPTKEGVYLVRLTTVCGDRYEAYSFFSKTERKIPCEYTGKEGFTHWSGSLQDIPYAWYNADLIE